MTDRYPGYDVLDKHDSLSWNDQTRRVIDARMALEPNAHAFFNSEEWPTVVAICTRIVPQPPERSRSAPLAAMVDAKLHEDARDGFRDGRLPPQKDAWRRAIAAFNAEARARFGQPFADLDGSKQDAVLAAAQRGDNVSDAWGDMRSELFFAKRLLRDVVGAYYSHPASWNEIGFGGPASPRGYVRMNFDRRDPWEASEARPGRERIARRENARVG